MTTWMHELLDIQPKAPMHRQFVNSCAKMASERVPRGNGAPKSGTTMPELKSTSPQQFSSAQVLFRIGFRLVLLITCASLGSQGFGPTFANLLVLLAVSCAIFAAIRRELIFCPTLTHWDEGAVYVALGLLTTALS